RTGVRSKADRSAGYAAQARLYSSSDCAINSAIVAQRWRVTTSPRRTTHNSQCGAAGCSTTQARDPPESSQRQVRNDWHWCRTVRSICIGLRSLEQLRYRHRVAYFARFRPPLRGARPGGNRIGIAFSILSIAPWRVALVLVVPQRPARRAPARSPRDLRLISASVPRDAKQIATGTPLAFDECVGQHRRIPI